MAPMLNFHARIITQPSVSKPALGPSSVSRPSFKFALENPTDDVFT